LKVFNLSVILQQTKPRVSLSIDFSFNMLRNVRKVNWKADCPWYAEVRDGLSWFGYCLNDKCVSYHKLFVVNRGYGIFKLESELGDLTCPVCMQD